MGRDERTYGRKEKVRERCERGRQYKGKRDNEGEGDGREGEKKRKRRE